MDTQIKASSQQICTHLRSSNIATLFFDFSLIIGINLSTIHWFSQEHFHGLYRISISSKSIQRSSNSSLIDVKLLAYKTIYDSSDRIDYKLLMNWRRKSVQRNITHTSNWWPLSRNLQFTLWICKSMRMNWAQMTITLAIKMLQCW